MKSILSWLMLAVCLSSVALGLAKNQPALLLKNAQIIDPQNQTVFRGYLIVRDGRIAEKGVQPPTTFAGEVIDLKGQWVAPGFNDLHVHAWGNSAGKYTQYTGIEGAQKINLAAGVTGILDLFNDEPSILKLRNDQRTNGFIGAELWSAGALLTCTGGHGTEYGGVPARVVNTPAEAKASVEELARKNPNVVKIVYDHARTMPSMNRATMTSAVQTARRLGLKTVIHIGTWKDAEEAVLSGATAITHLHETEIPDHLVRLMRERNVWAIPTLVVESEIVNFLETPQALDSDLARRLVQKDLVDFYANLKTSGILSDARFAKFLEMQKSVRLTMSKSIRKLAAGGVRILTGTDAGNLGVMLGFSVHREMELLVKAGLDPWQSLAASTTLAGNFMGRHFGTNVGDEANLVVLKASPLADIRNTQKISGVIFKGQIIRPEDLKANSN